MPDYKIEIIYEKEPVLKISEEIAECFDLLHKKETHVSFGLKFIETSIQIDANLSNDVIVISDKVIEKLSIPKECTYNINVENNVIKIGPFIGMYLGKSEANIIKKLGVIKNYVRNYSVISGAVLAFSLDQVNMENMTITGYLYNSKLDIWTKTSLPYPSSIFLRAPLNRSWREYFSVLYEGRIFNYKTINKWETYERLIQFPEHSSLLPPTILFEDIPNIIKFLNEYKSIYIKPIKGLKGLKIINVVKKADKITVRGSEGETLQNVERDFKDEDSFLSFIKENLVPGKFIAQKALDIQFEGKLIDFRVGLDKDQTGRWKHNMFVTRMSGSNNIISNRAGGGTAGRPDEVMKEIYNMSEKEANNYTDWMVKKCKLLANSLEKTGFNYGELVFDMSIDKNKKVWLIEINNKHPGSDLLLDLKEFNNYYEIRLMNMLYAKKLAGFDEKTNNKRFRFGEVLNKSHSKKIRYRIFIRGTVQNTKYQKHIKQISDKLNVTGNLKYSDDDKLLIVEVQGEKNEIVKCINQLKVRDNITKVKAVGIEQIRYVKSEENFIVFNERESILNVVSSQLQSNKRNLKKLEDQLQKERNKVKEALEENKRIKRKYNEIRNSRTFKYSQSLRRILSKVRKDNRS